MGKVQMNGDGAKRKYGHIGRKVGLVVAFMQIISVVLAVFICVFVFNGLVERMQKTRCTNGTNMLAYELGRVSDGEDKNQLLDDLKERMGCEFTIFEGDTRAYSTVMQDGERVVGTKLSSELCDIVLEKGQSYVGETEIMDQSFLCSYVPTEGADGEVNGLIFAGISKAEAERGTSIVIWLVTASGAVTILLCVIFLGIYLGKRVSKPLKKITQIALRLEHGDLGLDSGEEIRVNVRSNDEIGMLGQIFEGTIRRLRSYIGEIDGVLGSIADGDLTQDAMHDYMGDFHSIKVSLDSIGAGLNRAMGQIADSAGKVSVESDQVSGSAQSMAQGATEQASAVEEISATIADISENARQTSEAAAEVGNFVNQAGAQLGISMDYVRELDAAMGNISGTSKEISEIIATIENIAFQINILALNAAVEAARAGVAGKGFAVVADEVRNLASKSDEAAKATKELIEGSIAAVTEGDRAMSNVTESLERTGELAGNVTSRMSVVVEAIEKQSDAIAQVTEGVEQISAVVQTNSATSEECAAASEELSSQAGMLKRLMSSFKLKR